MKELIDETSNAKCDKIVEDISSCCKESEVVYIIRSLAKLLGTELNLKNGLACR
jgi:ribosomal protein L7Ae-like RNA K-turn-binding protein